MRKRDLVKSCILFEICIFITCLSLINSLSFIDNSASNFNKGTYSSVFYNSSGFIQLNSSKLNGNYISQIFNGTGNCIWNTISWVQSYCNKCSLPNNQAVEQGDFVNKIDMNGNILLYHFEELLGNAVDSSSNNNFGVPNGIVGYSIAGKFGNALKFDNSSVVVSDSNILDLSSQGTLSLWIKPDSVIDFAGLIHKGEVTNFSDESYSLQFWNNQKVRLIITNSTDSLTLENPQTIYADNWYNIIGTWDSSGMKIYVNGISNFSSDSLVAFNSNGRLIIGSQLFSAYGFNGTIDEVAIWNRRLTDAEILGLYKKGILMLNLTIRSCNNSLCSGESFIDIDETSPHNLDIQNNQFFQYNFAFESENESFTPELYNVNIDYVTNYCGDNICSGGESCSICLTDCGECRHGGDGNIFYQSGLLDGVLRGDVKELTPSETQDFSTIGIERIMKKNEVIPFYFKDNSLIHSLKILEVYKDYVILLLASTLQQVNLTVGETKRIRLSSQEYDDLLIKLNEVVKTLNAYGANVSIKDLTGVKASIFNIGEIIGRAGESKTMSIEMQNIGSVFLNSCRLRAKGYAGSWIYCDDIKGFSPGEKSEFVFKVNIPDNINESSYSGKLIIVCEERDFEQDFNVTIQETGVQIVDIKQGKNKLLINYTFDASKTLEDSVSIDIWLTDEEGNELKRMKDSFNVNKLDLNYRNIVFQLKDITPGIYNIYFAPSNDLSNFVKQSIVLSEKSVTGEAILGTTNSKGIIYIIFVVIIVIVVFLIFRKRDNQETM